MHVQILSGNVSEDEMGMTVSQRYAARRRDCLVRDTLCLHLLMIERSREGKLCSSQALP